MKNEFWNSFKILFAISFAYCWYWSRALIAQNFSSTSNFSFQIFVLGHTRAPTKEARTHLYSLIMLMNKEIDAILIYSII